MAIIWTTASINETIEKMRFMPSDRINTTCFYERKFDLKAANITFQLTPEEELEYIKCSQDIVYFVSKYCKFLTDKGQATVDLRKYQKEILNTLGEEEWLEDLEEFAPVVRDYILMASRQVGKCLSPNTNMYIKDIKNNIIFELSMSEFYNLIVKNSKTKKSLKQIIIFYIKKILYKIYNLLSNENKKV